METTLDDRYVVFVRQTTGGQGVDSAERELGTCSTYEEALWVRREYGGPLRKCIIR